MSGKNSRGSREALLFDGLDNNPAAPAQIATGKRQRLYRRLLYFAVFAVIPLSLLSSLAAVSSSASSTKVSAATISTQANDVAGRAAATIAVEAWLGHSPSPLPGGHIISWDGYTTIEQDPAVSEATKVTYEQQIHHFTLASDGIIYDCQIVVFVDDVAGVSTPTAPSLLPRFTGSSTTINGVTPWIGYVSVDAPKNVDVAVQAWADALVSGDRDRLLQVTGDPSGDDLYLPLEGVVSAETTVLATAVPAATAKDGNRSPKQVVAQVSMRLKWGGVPEGSQGLAEVTYDVLVDKADTASPTIVSWGGSGSAPSLTPYSVALKGVKNVPIGKAPSKPVTTPTPVSNEPKVRSDG